MTQVKSGVELIAEERHEQIHAHKHNDARYQHDELMVAANYCLSRLSHQIQGEYPYEWSYWFQGKLDDKKQRLSWPQYKIEVLKIAGALIAAEIDRLQKTPTHD